MSPTLPPWVEALQSTFEESPQLGFQWLKPESVAKATELLVEGLAFRDLSVELAQRLTSSTDIVMVAMALDIACSGQEPVDKALEHLQEFAIANRLGHGGDDIDLGDDEDDDDEDEDEDEDDDDDDDDDD